MATREKPLPEHRNPMLEEDRAPSHEILVERRCLGQTELKVKPGQIGTSSATKLENLGVLDYAHLRVPLPKDLTGSGIFHRGPNRKWPEAYFLMRRSSDGFISATGMFKAAFPYAGQEEEAAEKEYIKSLEEASSEEVAGNVWIRPEKALELADEYGIKLWIAALLDPEPITHGNGDPKKMIRSPPNYNLDSAANSIGRTPVRSAVKETGNGRRSTRGVRSMRSVSPSKAQVTPRKIATPRRSRTTRGVKASVEENTAIEEESEHVNGDKEEKVKVEVTSTLVPDENGVEQVEQTKLKVHLPTDHPDLKQPEDIQEALAQAREMVEIAKSIPGAGSSSSKGKRKAAEMAEADEERENEAASRMVKRVKPVEVELRKEKIRRRALTGIVASVAFGALIPSIISAFPWT